MTAQGSEVFNALWPIFGTANQMLAALSLLAVSPWLLLRRRKAAFTLVPAVFMMVTTLASLGILFVQYVRQKSWLLVAADLVLFVLGIGVVAMYVRAFTGKKKGLGPAAA